MMSLCWSIGTSGWISNQWSVGVAFGRVRLQPSRRVVVRYGEWVFVVRAGGVVRGGPSWCSVVPGVCG
jgi:hypothetical protein